MHASSGNTAVPWYQLWKGAGIHREIFVGEGMYSHAHFTKPHPLHVENSFEVTMLSANYYMKCTHTHTHVAHCCREIVHRQEARDPNSGGGGNSNTGWGGGHRILERGNPGAPLRNPGAPLQNPGDPRDDVTEFDTVEPYSSVHLSNTTEIPYLPDYRPGLLIPSLKF